MDNFYNKANDELDLKRLTMEANNNRPLTFEDPNNAPPTDKAAGSEKRHSLLFESIPVSKTAPNAFRHVRNRTESFSHSSRHFSLQLDVPIAQTSSTPGSIQRRPTVSGLELSMNRNSNLSDQKARVGILDAFSPGLFSAGWNNFTPKSDGPLFTPTNQSPLNGLISADVPNIPGTAPLSAAPLSAVDTVVSAIDFLDIGSPTSVNLVEDPFKTFSSTTSSVPAVLAPGAQSRLRSYSSAFVNPAKPAQPFRHRSISIPEKMRLELDGIHPFVPETTNSAVVKSLDSDSITPTRSLWIGNLDLNISQDELTAIFVPYGPIESIRMIPERECAFINFMNVEDASKANTALNGGHIGDCIIKIAYGKVDFSADFIANNASKSLWIGNIPATLEPVDLVKIFSRFGPIESARVLSHKNCGFINFIRLEDAADARKQMNGKEISGAIVKIGFAKVPNSNSVTPTASSTLTEAPYGNQCSIGVSPAAGNNLLSPSNRVNQFSSQSPGIFTYASSIPGLPNSENSLDNNVMRDLRKRLENTNVSSEQVAEIFDIVIKDAAAVAADYIGNVVIQKIIEKGTEDQRLQIIQQVAPFMASIGIHKNGTWAIQKILDTAQCPQHIAVIVQAITRSTPCLLLDQYGNYVVQCCLRFGGNQNQFIFEAISLNILKIGLARFGARATRTCLESQFTSKAQQKLVASSIIKNWYELSCDQNGALLVSWLLDSYSGAGKYAELVSAFKQHSVSACTHKIASAFVLKMCVQKTEPEARDSILDVIFSKNLIPILSDPVNGTSLIRKILTTSPSDQARFTFQMSRLISKSDIQRHASIKRFVDEFSITVNNDSISR